MQRAENHDLPPDVIIVLGAAVWQGGQPSPALRRRMAHAVRLFHAGKGRALLVTGGLGLHPPREAHVMRRLAIDGGIPAARIFVEDQATSTFQSALRCTHILRQYGWSTALIVTDRYHLPRALLTFRSLGVCALGSAAQDGRYSRHFWRVWYYQGRETLALLWYLLLIARAKIRCCRSRRCTDAPLLPKE